MSRGKLCVNLALAKEIEPATVSITSDSDGRQRSSADDVEYSLFPSETAIDVMSTPIIIEGVDRHLLIEENNHVFMDNVVCDNQQQIPLSNDHSNFLQNIDFVSTSSVSDAEKDPEFFPTSDPEIDQHSSEAISESDGNLFNDISSGNGKVIEEIAEQYKNLVPYSDTESDESDVENLPTKQINESKVMRRKRHDVNEATCNSKKVKLGREKGLKYCGRKKVEGKWRYNIMKKQRVLNRLTATKN